MRLVAVGAVAALVVGVLVSGYAARTAIRAKPPESPSAGPTVAAAPAPSARSGEVRTTDVPPAGLNVRYLGPDGKAQNLDVKNFPR